MLEMKHIYKYYNPGTVNEMCLFEDFSLTVEQGQFVSVVGSNGSGKNFSAKYYLREYSRRFRKHSHPWNGYFENAGVQTAESHWPRLPESFYGNLSQHDDSGKHVSGRYQGKALQPAPGYQ